MENWGKLWGKFGTYLTKILVGFMLHLCFLGRQHYLQNCINAVSDMYLYMDLWIIKFSEINSYFYIWVVIPCQLHYNILQYYNLILSTLQYLTFSSPNWQHSFIFSLNADKLQHPPLPSLLLTQPSQASQISDRRWAVIWQDMRTWEDMGGHAMDKIKYSETLYSLTLDILPRNRFGQEMRGQFPEGC